MKLVVPSISRIIDLNQVNRTVFSSLRLSGVMRVKDLAPGIITRLTETVCARI